MRKPKNLDLKKQRQVLYGGIERTIKSHALGRDYGRCVYIGGAYYSDSAQIHLNEEEVYALSKWLTKVSLYLKKKRVKGLHGEISAFED